MLTVGRVCIKIAGRDAGKKAVIVDIIDDNYVFIDGEVRRKKCNILHLEPLDTTVDIEKNASHVDVLHALGIKEEKKKTTKKEKTQRPRRMRIKKTYAEPKKVKITKIKKDNSY